MVTDRLGRVRAAVAVLVALAVPLGLLINARAGAMMDSQLAAAAVAQALAALPQADAPVATPTPGRPATGDERAAIVKLGGQFRDLLRERKLDGAWELTAPDGRGEWTAAEWVAAQGEALDRALPEGSDNSGMPGAIPLVMGASRLSVAATRVELGRTVVVVRLTVELEYPLVMAFRRIGSGWAIDLARCERLQAKTAIRSQVDSATSFDETVADLIAPVGQELKRTCESVTVDGGEAVAQFRVKGALGLDVGVERKGTSWKLGWLGPMRVVAPDAPTDARALKVMTANRSDQCALAASLARTVACMTNMKQLWLAAMVYCTDYDEQFPIAYRWCDGTMPYHQEQAIYNCPSDDAQWSYALNYKLSRQAMGKLEMPSETVLLFETEPSRKNAYDKGAQPGDSMALPPRHGEMNNFAWTDGHVTAQRPADVGPEMYRLGGPRSLRAGASEALPAEMKAPTAPPPPPGD